MEHDFFQAIGMMAQVWLNVHHWYKVVNGSIEVLATSLQERIGLVEFADLVIYMTDMGGNRWWQDIQ